MEALVILAIIVGLSLLDWAAVTFGADSRHLDAQPNW